MALTSLEAVRGAWLLDPEDLPEDSVLQGLIGRAERLLRGLSPSLGDRAARDPDLADRVQDVVVAMVLRVVSNPEGVRSTSETTGPLTTSVTYGGSDPGQLFVTDTEKDLLGIRRGRRRQAAFSVSMRPRG
ncbi:Gp19/Gp15/Gp42 family protein [Actinomyces howellii]|uniref:Phage protein Gp19/Gp15/Gp42 n=1 Tax=Actinomyces howellii TaxID=52771 RepID=A0A448HGP1_9ACTO|nr:Gp19/Gp15/Gp42 family protein [Actinomyces howellii]VEG28042.1 Phage protein Gp19/Gp15/Gp42 [Actinomyces howellii]